MPYAANSSIASISIHAPLTGSDQYKIIVIERFDISIHAPLTGSDSANCRFFPQCCAFQSTLPLRGATISRYKRSCIQCNFNPRSPYGERPHLSDASFPGTEFQSTLPLRGATGWLAHKMGLPIISIHAPLTGSDAQPVETLPLETISIHAPLTGSDVLKR